MTTFRRQPLHVGVELSNLCNLHCTHCIRGSHQPSIDRLDLARLRDLLDQASALFDPLSIVFTGGEPLAAEFFPDAVAELASRAIPYAVVSNGWLVPRHLPLLVRHPPRFVRVSLSGASERTHDAQRGRGSWRRALLAVAALRSRGLRADLSLVVTRDSRTELSEAVALARALGAAELHVCLPQPTVETAIEGSDLSPAEWNDVTREVHALAAESAVPVFLDYGDHAPLPRPACHTLALRQLYVDAQGRVPFCCQLSRYGTGAERILGDLATEPLAAILARAEAEYAGFATETTRRHAAGEWDAFDDYPCLSCARRHGRTGFLADFPEHPWTGLARAPRAANDAPAAGGP